MSDKVEVVFGANIAGLIAGVDGVTEKLETINGAVQGIQESFVGLGEAFTAIFAVEKIENFVESISDMGGKIESASAQLGLADDKIIAMQYAAEIADTTLDQATKTLDHFFMSAQEASVATSKQAAAFKALGINAKEYLDQGHSLNDLLDLSVSRLGKFADGASKTTIIMDLFGNRSAQTVRFINTLSDGIEDLTRVSEALGAPTEENIKTLNEMHVRLVDLGKVSENFGMRMADLGLLAVKAAEGFVEFLSIVGSVFDGVGIILVTAAKEIKNFSAGAAYSLGSIFNQDLKQKAHDAFAAIPEDARTATAAIGDLIKKEKEFIDELENPKLKGVGVNKDGKQAPRVDISSGSDERLHKWEAELKQQLLTQQLFYEDATRYEVSFWTAKKNIAESGTKEYQEIISKLYDLQKREAAQNLAAYKSDIEEQQAAAGDDITRKIALQDKLLQYMKMYYAADTTAYNQALAKRHQLELQAEKAAEATWNRFFNGFNSGIEGMLKRTSTWRQFMQQAAMNVFDSWLKTIEKLVAHWIAMEVTKTTATTTANAARVASDKAAASASAQGFGAGALKQIQGDAAKAYGGVYGFLAPSIGPFAAVPAAAAYVSVIAMEGLIPSFAVGSWNIPVDTVAQLHAGERVMTAEENRAYSAGGGGGAMQLHIHGGINDAASIRALLMREGPTIARSMKNQSNNFNSNLTPGKK